MRRREGKKEKKNAANSHLIYVQRNERIVAAAAAAACAFFFLVRFCYFILEWRYRILAYRIRVNRREFDYQRRTPKTITIAEKRSTKLKRKINVVPTANVFVIGSMTFSLPVVHNQHFKLLARCEKNKMFLHLNTPFPSLSLSYRNGHKEQIRSKSTL